jgi:hypothetical protein
MIKNSNSGEHSYNTGAADSLYHPAREERRNDERKKVADIMAKHLEKGQSQCQKETD